MISAFSAVDDLLAATVRRCLALSRLSSGVICYCSESSGRRAFAEASNELQESFQAVLGFAHERH